MGFINTLALSLLLLFSISLVAQDKDAIFKVAKAKPSFQVLPDLDRLRSGMLYDFIIPDMKSNQIKKMATTLGTVTYKQASNKKDIDLKINVTAQEAKSGTITVFGDGDKVLLRREYKIIATVRFMDYSPASLSSPASGYAVVLMLNKDTVADNGTISLKQIQAATSLSLIDANLSTKYIRKNLMCKITVKNDSSSVVLHSSLDRLSDKVKSGFAKVKAGDRLLIENMENLWIDANRDDHIEPYGYLMYEVTVTE